MGRYLGGIELTGIMITTTKRRRDGEKDSLQEKAKAKKMKSNSKLAEGSQETTGRSERTDMFASRGELSKMQNKRLVDTRNESLRVYPMEEEEWEEEQQISQVSTGRSELTDMFASRGELSTTRRQGLVEPEAANLQIHLMEEEDEEEEYERLQITIVQSEQKDMFASTTRRQGLVGPETANLRNHRMEKENEEEEHEKLQGTLVQSQLTDMFASRGELFTTRRQRSAGSNTTNLRVHPMNEGDLEEKQRTTQMTMIQSQQRDMFATRGELSTTRRQRSIEPININSRVHINEQEDWEEQHLSALKKTAQPKRTDMFASRGELSTNQWQGVLEMKTHHSEPVSKGRVATTDELHIKRGQGSGLQGATTSCIHIGEGGVRNEVLGGKQENGNGVQKTQQRTRQSELKDMFASRGELSVQQRQKKRKCRNQWQMTQCQ